MAELPLGPTSATALALAAYTVTIELLVQLKGQGVLTATQTDAILPAALQVLERSNGRFTPAELDLARDLVRELLEL